MASLKYTRLSVILFLIYVCAESRAKLNENKTNDNSAEVKTAKKHTNDGASLLFADEFKQTLEKYLFGICPQTFKSPGGKAKNATSVPCDLDAEHQELAGRLATLALRAHTAARADCARFANALANSLGELARTAANQQAIAAATAESNKKRKLSKSQKMKIQAKQRTALAVKKKAAAAAAAAAAKMTSPS